MWPRPFGEGWVGFKRLKEEWLAPWRKRRLVRLGALGSVWPDGYRLIQKARGGFSGAGLIVTMKICR
jgi:hypothetical protein